MKLLSDDPEMLDSDVNSDCINNKIMRRYYDKNKKFGDRMGSFC